MDRPSLDPLATLVSLLRPRTVSPKIIAGAGRWHVRYAEVASAGFGLVLEGGCTLRLDGGEPIALSAGDFVLMPPTSGFAMYSHAKAKPLLLSPDASVGLTELRHGETAREIDFRLLGGYFEFAPTNTNLLLGLLPRLIHIQAADTSSTRLSTTIAALTDEARHRRPGRDLIVERLVEVMLIEALRFHAAATAFQPGLLAGLRDPQLAIALNAMHAEPARAWTVGELARQSGLSRSAFSERFSRTLGAPPLEYLLQWRMALAKDMLLRQPKPLEQVAAAIGYESASAFSTAFRRRIGQPPSQYARAARPR